MKRILFFLLLGASLAVVAQQVFLQPQKDPPVAEETTEGVAGTDEPADGDEAAGEDADAAAEEQQATADTALEAPAEQAEDEAADEVDMEFEPDEEISEDYPVPLPSDI